MHGTSNCTNRKNRRCRSKRMLSFIPTWAVLRVVLILLVCISQELTKWFHLNNQQNTTLKLIFSTWGHQISKEKKNAVYLHCLNCTDINAMEKCSVVLFVGGFIQTVAFLLFSNGQTKNIMCYTYEIETSRSAYCLVFKCWIVRMQRSMWLVQRPKDCWYNFWYNVHTFLQPKKTIYLVSYNQNHKWTKWSAHWYFDHNLFQVSVWWLAPKKWCITYSFAEVPLRNNRSRQIKCERNKPSRKDSDHSKYHWKQFLHHLEK
jgi:hypothetical protein